MPDFIETSVVNSTTVKNGTPAIATAQQSVTTTVISPPAPTASSILTTVVGSSGGLSGISAAINGNPNAVQKIENAAISADASIASNYLQSALKSINGTFGSSKTSLASGITSALSNIFGNTNVKTAATTTTVISDPVKTNLLGAAAPLANTFKIDSAQAGSQTIGSSGTSSVFGTGAASMTGVNLTTLIGRFNLDSPTNLGTSITNSLASKQINGLFTTLAATAGSIVSTQIGGGVLGNTLGKLTTTAVAQGLGVTPTATTLTPATNNNLQTFLGSTSGLSSALGGSTNLSSYFLPSSSYSLVTSAGTPVDTSNSGVDATTANAIVQLIKLAGCALTGTNYNSASTQASIFNTSLSLAALNGMSSEISSLLGCSQATTTLGQQSLVNAFASSSGTQIGSANTIIGSIASPTMLNTPFISQNILTNPNLTASSVPTVNNIFTTMGTSTTTALSIPGLSTSQYPVVNLATISQAQPSFVNAVYGDTTLTDALSGQMISSQQDGSLDFTTFSPF